MLVHVVMSVANWDWFQDADLCMAMLLFQLHTRLWFAVVDVFCVGSHQTHSVFAVAVYRP